MFRFLFLSIVFLFFIGCESSELISLTLLFRHGSRAPRKVFDSDPYKSRIAEIWPEGLSQLTKLGKQQQYSLGLWYRQRYSEFIPEKYDPTFLRVLSSNKDRCLMSAAVNLAGLFPPKGEQIWNSNIPWQPIPIHTSPIEQDVLISNKRKCKKYEKLSEELKDTYYYKKFMSDSKCLFDYLTKNIGENISTLDDATFVHDTFFIEDYFNLTLPNWSKKVFPVSTLPLLIQVFVLETNNTALARLKSGPLINYITSFFEDVIKDPTNSQKLLMLSVHDSTLAHLMNTLQIYDGTWTEYASTLMFELRREKNTEFLNVYFKNSTMLRNIRFKECNFDCPFEKFKEIVKPFRITEQERETECLNV
ncbi:prostatic acid phosphatase-like [Diorhabda sublineata]|uniref:prostatic acid phosphatase-like n=1 Tax=Diorhabda sublineata TaxID=1163346 RepID=UPI0024E18E91|nr:prostatic acid phosphatase-like [Diorhabda sublineata]